ncbi:hypothetical protein [uncultured Polaribacter sp.]|uniref:hypothetical protein n=1 Tax=uncultured Polaribacter sp. TaxID=174711 RepID=UPI00259B5411|nr:hypothetical protein [uncultured Polaribacter sp.]
MVKNFKKIKFATYSNLEEYFTKIILPQKNKSSKVIGRTLLVWDKPKGAAMSKTYQVISISDLEKVNKKSISMGRNQNIPVQTIKDLKADGKVVAIVSGAFPHNEVEQRLVLFTGDKHGTLLCDVSFDDYKKFVKPLTMEAA